MLEQLGLLKGGQDHFLGFYPNWLVNAIISRGPTSRARRRRCRAVRGAGGPTHPPRGARPKKSTGSPNKSSPARYVKKTLLWCLGSSRANIIGRGTVLRPCLLCVAGRPLGDSNGPGISVELNEVVGVQGIAELVLDGVGISRISSAGEEDIKGDSRIY